MDISNIQTFIPSLIPSLILFLLGWWKSSKMSTLLDKQTKEIENLKFNNQKKIIAYEIFISKKHILYVNLYEKLNEAINEVNHAVCLYGSMPLVSNMSKDEFCAEIDKLELSDIVAKNIKELFDIDKLRAEKDFQHYYFLSQEILAKKCVYNAIQTLDKVKLYIPKYKWEEFEKFNNDLYFLIDDKINASINLYKYNEPIRNIEKYPEKAKELKEQFDELCIFLQNQIGVNE